MKKKVKGIESKKNLQFAGLGVVLIGLFLISVVVFADTSSLGKHVSTNVIIKVNNIPMTLEYAIKKNYYSNETANPISSDTGGIDSIPSGGHDASQIFVMVKGYDSSLEEAINGVWVDNGCEAAGGDEVGSLCRFNDNKCPEGWSSTGYTTTVSKTCLGLSSNNSADFKDWSLIEKCEVNESNLKEEDSCTTSSSSWGNGEIPNCTARYEVAENEALNISEKCLIGTCKAKITQISCVRDSGSVVSIGLCGQPGDSYSGDIFVGHKGEEIWLEGYEKTLQQAIIDQDFCYTYAWDTSDNSWSQTCSCPAGKKYRTVWCNNSNGLSVDYKFCDSDTKPANETDCSCATCGNGVVETGEDCDDGAGNTDTECTPACDSSCTYCDTSCNSYTVNGEECGPTCIPEGELCGADALPEYEGLSCCSVDGMFGQIQLDCVTIGGCDPWADPFCGSSICVKPSGGGTCFVAGTQVLMVDGSLKSIEDVVIGEKVIGMNGNVNTVLEYERPVIGSRSTYILNNEIEFTGDHPFLTTKGWKVADLELFNSMERGFEVEEKELSIGDVLITKNGYERVDSLVESRERPFEEIVYDILLDGDHTFIANDYIVHNCVGGT